MKTESIGADILLEAHQLVTGARQASYGNVTEDYSKVITIFEGFTISAVVRSILEQHFGLDTK